MFPRNTMANEAIPLNELRGRPVQDQRSEQRFLVEREAPILRDDRRLTVWVVECSARGIGLVISEPMTVDSKFELAIGPADKRRAIYRVCHCRKLWEAAYQIGASLCGDINDLEFQAMLGWLLSSPSA